MRLSEKCRPLIDEIQGLFAAGIPIDSRTLRFISAMGEEPSPAFFERVLTDEGDCEAESLIELIFSPDEPMQMRLETLLEKERHDAADEAALIETLTESRPRARLHLFGDATPMVAKVPAGAVSAFISRLHITRKLSPLLKAAIDSETTLHNRSRLKVRLRNSALAQTASEIDFLCLFLKRVKETSAEFFPCFDFLLAFLGERPNVTDYRSAMIRMRQNYEQQEDRAAQFEARLATSNMETLMLQGNRPPVIGAAQAREKIERIDTLLQVLYG